MNEAAMTDADHTGPSLGNWSVHIPAAVPMIVRNTTAPTDHGAHTTAMNADPTPEFDLS